jgi:hypothetical protein
MKEKGEGPSKKFGNEWFNAWSAFLNRWQQSISPTFYEQLFHHYSFSNKLQSQTVSREKLCKTLLYKKAAFKRPLFLKFQHVMPGYMFTKVSKFGKIYFWTFFAHPD